MGFYNKYSFDEELTTWSIDGGGVFFYRKPHKFSVTNVGGWIRVLNKNVLNPRFMTYALSVVAKIAKYDWTHKAHPSVIRKELSIPFPPLEIQNKIVTILDTYNEITELQAERVRLLKLEKDILLEKIFAPEGGFKFSLNGKNFDTGEWVRGRIADYAPITSESGVLGEEFYGNVISTENMIPNAGGLKTFDREPWKGTVGIAQPNDIIVSRIRPYFRKVHLSDSCYAVGGDTPVFRAIPDKADFGFVFTLLSSQLYSDHLMNTITGMAIPRADKSAMQDYIARFPSLEDQRLISDYFREVDRRIKLEEERLQLLKIQQEVVLEQIFSK